MRNDGRETTVSRYLGGVEAGVVVVDDGMLVGVLRCCGSMVLTTR